MNQCTKAGKTHSSLSEPTQDTIITAATSSGSSNSKQSTGFVKASQLLGKNDSSLISSCGRSCAQPSFVPASKLMQAGFSSSVRIARTSRCSSEPETPPPLSTASSSMQATTTVTDSGMRGFCLASELLPSQQSDHMTIKKRAVPLLKRDLTPDSTVNVPPSPPQTCLPKSSALDSKLNSVTVVSDSERGAVAGGVAVETSKSKLSSRKQKIDQAVAKTKKITYFFEK